VEEDVKRIALRIRRWREAEGHTLQELARRSGVASSTIHKIESLQMVPTIAVLLKIARGLGRRVSELVHEDNDGLPVVLQTPEERTPLEVEGRVIAHRLVGELIDPIIEVWRVRHNPGTGIEYQEMRFDGEILILCEEGELEVVVDDEVYRVRSGDSLHFKASLGHTWMNRTEHPAQFLVVGTLSQAMRSILGDRLRRLDVPLDVLEEKSSS
jgi:transcriptional regulator with XRE-family HTH domain